VRPGPSHGTHLRDPQGHHVRPLGQDGEGLHQQLSGDAIGIARRVADVDDSRERTAQVPEGEVVELVRHAEEARRVAHDGSDLDCLVREVLLAVGSGQAAAAYEEVVYEGYAPHGIAVLVECATDNPTRTVANVRTHFGRLGGNMGATGSVGFQFKRMGVFRLDPTGIDQEALELDLIDHGLEEMGESTSDKGEPQLVVRCAFADFGQLQKALEDRKITPRSAESEYVAQTPLELPEEKVFNNIQRYGNTTAASVPIALHEAVLAGRVKPGALVCLAAFGAGFTCAAALMRW